MAPRIPPLDLAGLLRADRLEAAILAQPADELVETALELGAFLVRKLVLGDLAKVPLFDIVHDRVLLQATPVRRRGPSRP